MKSKLLVLHLIFFFQLWLSPMVIADVPAPVTRPGTLTSEHLHVPFVGKARYRMSALKVLKSVKKQSKHYRAHGSEGTPRVHGLAIAGFVLSIVSLVLPLIIGIASCIIAIIFCAVAMSRIRREPEKYSGFGFAVAGLVIGIVVLALILILLGISAA